MHAQIFTQPFTRRLLLTSTLTLGHLYPLSLCTVYSPSYSHCDTRACSRLLVCLVACSLTLSLSRALSLCRSACHSSSFALALPFVVACLLLLTFISQHLLALVLPRCLVCFCAIRITNSSRITAVRMKPMFAHLPSHIWAFSVTLSQ